MATFAAPSVEELKKLSDRFGMACSEEELNAYHNVLKGSVAGYAKVQAMVEPMLPLSVPRTPGYRPPPSENIHNAWYWKCSVKKAGSVEGLKLANKKVAVKDNVLVAGVPLMIGSRTLEGYVPEQDATVVRWMLEAGAEVVGKTATEDLCLSGASFLTTYGPVLNPYGPYTAGGSSSGSAVVVATGEADMAIGGDQGGSIRIPASSCGIVGMKPTFGLVPYTGIAQIETSLDCAGPMTRTVKDCATMLEVIAGFDDNRDCRQPSNGFTCPEYSKELEKPTGKLKLAVLKEGFDMSTESVVEIVKTAVESIKKSGKFAVVDDCSVPLHREAHHLWGVIGIQGGVDQMVEGTGYGTGQSGHLVSSLSEKLRQGLSLQSRTLSHTSKFITMFATFVKEKYGLAIYAKAATLALELRRQYDAVLEHYDALLLPTLPDVPANLPADDASITDTIALALGTIANTCPFNLTHHPALTLNAGFCTKDGKRPVGLMIVGKHFQDATLLQIAATVEETLKPFQS